jgi:hypothetical protein
MKQTNQSAQAMDNWWESPIIRQELNLEVEGNTSAIGYVEFYLAPSVRSAAAHKYLETQARATLLQLMRNISESNL